MPRSNERYRLKYLIPFGVAKIPRDGELFVIIYDNLWWAERINFMGDLVGVLIFDAYPVIKITMKRGLVVATEYAIKVTVPIEQNLHVMPITMKGWSRKRLAQWISHDERIEFTRSQYRDTAYRFKDVCAVEKL